MTTRRGASPKPSLLLRLRVWLRSRRRRRRGGRRRGFGRRDFGRRRADGLGPSGRRLRRPAHRPLPVQLRVERRPLRPPRRPRRVGGRTSRGAKRPRPERPRSASASSRSATRRRSTAATKGPLEVSASRGAPSPRGFAGRRLPRTSGRGGASIASSPPPPSPRRVWSNSREDVVDEAPGIEAENGEKGAIRDGIGRSQRRLGGSPARRRGRPRVRRLRGSTPSSVGRSFSRRPRRRFPRGRTRAGCAGRCLP